MSDCTVTFVKEKRTVKVKPHTTILYAQRMAGLIPDAPCGGMGQCGKCQVDLSDGENIARVKACCTFVEKDIQVYTLDKTQHSQLREKGKAGKTEFVPALQIVHVTIKRCAPGESRSDWNRLCDALCEKTGNSQYGIPGAEGISKIGSIIKNNQGKATVILLNGAVLNILPAEEKEETVLAVVFDIGTTSVVGYLLNMKTGSQISCVSSLNEQRKYGADVIMRANYVLENRSMGPCDCIRRQLGEMIGELCESGGVQREEIYQVCIAGNTCMHHLFLGISPDSLVRAPYNPVISQALDLKAADYGIMVYPQARLWVLPVIAGFVGADTVGCMLAMDMEHEEKMTLLIDIGTNGEIVLGNRHRRIACSTAAGPAFEGAKITCGMRGSEGAVEHVTLDERSQPVYQVIGGGEPVGICGSGLVDLIAVLLDLGVIDESGYMEMSTATFVYEEKTAWLISQTGSGDETTGVFLTQKDVREVQMAKGAIAAGIQLMAKQMGIEICDIEQVYIAGAFGNYMRAESACRIGMLPGELLNRIVPVGNAAGDGAKIAVLNKKEWLRAQRLAEQTEFLELATLAEFQDYYVDALDFPEVEE